MVIRHDKALRCRMTAQGCGVYLSAGDAMHRSGGFAHYRIIVCVCVCVCVCVFTQKFGLTKFLRVYSKQKNNKEKFSRQACLEQKNNKSLAMRDGQLFSSDWREKSLQRGGQMH